MSAPILIATNTFGTPAYKAGAALPSYIDEVQPPLVYLADTFDMTFMDNTLHVGGPTGLAQGIHAYNTVDLEIKSCTFKGSSSRALYAKGGTNLSLQLNTFQNTTGTGIYVEDHTQPDLFANVLGIQNQTPGLKLMHDGITLRNCEGATVSSNMFYGVANAIQVYNAVPALTNNHLTLNKIYDAKFGVTFATHQHPHTRASTMNSLSDSVKLNIYCNLFERNEVAIFGSGNLSKQGGSGEGASNKFTGVTDWHVLTSSSGTLVYYIHHPSHNYNTVVNYAGSMSNRYMNGVLTNSSTISSTNSLYGTCYSNLYLNIKQAEDTNGDISLYPNPGNNSVNILSQNGLAIKEVSVYNSVGQLVEQLAYPSSTIDIHHLPKGFYICKFSYTQTDKEQYKKLIIAR